MYTENTFLPRPQIAEDLLGRTKTGSNKANGSKTKPSKGLNFKSHQSSLYSVVHACNPRTPEGVGGNYFKFEAGLHSNFQASQDCTKRLYPKTK